VWEVPPDGSDSMIQIVPLRGHVQLLGSRWTTAYTVQLYGMCLDAVVAENTFDTTPFYAWGRNPHSWGYEPNWNIEVLSNTLPNSKGLTALTCDEKYNICHEGANMNGLYNGALNTAIRISRNSLLDGMGITVHGTESSVTIEYNTVHNGAGGFLNAPVQVNYTYAQHVTERLNTANADTIV
jgi:hypothetical protein